MLEAIADVMDANPAVLVLMSTGGCSHGKRHRRLVVLVYTAGFTPSII